MSTESHQVHHGSHLQILVLDRRLAATRTMTVPYVVISIRDSHISIPDAVLASSSERRAILRLRFDDVNDPERIQSEYQPFSEAHAAQIIRFLSN